MDGRSICPVAGDDNEGNVGDDGTCPSYADASTFNGGVPVCSSASDAMRVEFP